MTHSTHLQSSRPHPMLCIFFLRHSSHCSKKRCITSEPSIMRAHKWLLVQKSHSDLVVEETFFSTSSGVFQRTWVENDGWMTDKLLRFGPYLYVRSTRLILNLARIHYHGLVQGVGLWVLPFHNFPVYGMMMSYLCLSKGGTWRSHQGEA